MGRFFALAAATLGLVACNGPGIGSFFARNDGKAVTPPLQLVGPLQVASVSGSVDARLDTASSLGEPLSVPLIRGKSLHSQWYSMGLPGANSIAEALDQPLPVADWVQDKLPELYSRNRPLWFTGQSWRYETHELIGLIRSAYAHGLFANDYIPESLQQPQSIPPHQVYSYDVLLSSALLAYMNDMAFGKTKPNPKKATALFRKALAQSDFVSFVEAQAPRSYFYRCLHQAALQQLSPVRERVHNFSALVETLEHIRTKGAPSIGQSPKILVNIAAFEMQAFDSGRLELASSVIVGKEGRRSPIGPDRLISIKWSPDWTAPRLIAEEDLYPRLLEDPLQFTQFGFVVSLDGKPVSNPERIDWAGISNKRVSFYQKPGPDNVLGGVRFTLGNSRAIYMHDTAYRSPYARAERAESSGCIRIEQASQLAAWVLEKDKQSFSPGLIAQKMSMRQSSFTQLKRTLPVEILYHTAWVDGQGRLKLMRDIYGKNHKLRAALAQNHRRAR